MTIFSVPLITYNPRLRLFIRKRCSSGKLHGESALLAVTPLQRHLEQVETVHISSEHVLLAGRRPVVDASPAFSHQSHHPSLQKQIL